MVLLKHRIGVLIKNTLKVTDEFVYMMADEEEKI